MKHTYIKSLLVFTILAVILAACAAPGSEGTAQPGNTPQPTQDSGQEEVVFDPNDPILAIKKFLYENYGIAPGDVRLVAQMEQEWSDSCLGLGGPEELCMQVITPGFVVTVETPKGMLTFHTAATLDRFRMKESLEGELPSRFDAAARFQWLLAGRLNIPFEQVQILLREAVDWPNACLGVEEEGILCAQVITPGYRLTLSTPQGEVLIHTDANMIYYRSPQPLPGEDRFLLEWERSGGIAGICEHLVIQFDGAYQLTDCKNDLVLFEGVLDLAAYEELVKKAMIYGITTWNFQPPAGSADMFVDGYTFNGAGSQVADEAQLASLNEFFDSLVSHIKSQPTTK